MALQKTKVLFSGEIGTYWKVTKVISDKKLMIIHCLLELFLDKDHADLPHADGAGLVKPFDFHVTLSEINGGLYALAYSKIKEKANTIIKAAVAHQDAIPEVIADPDNGIEGSPAVPEVPASPAVHYDEDLSGATDV